MGGQEQPSDRLLTIGQLAAATGTPATTLRYYDRRVCFPPWPGRGASADTTTPASPGSW